MLLEQLFELITEHLSGSARAMEKQKTPVILFIILFVFGAGDLSAQVNEQWRIVVVPDGLYDSNSALPQIHQVIHRRLTQQLGDADFQVISNDYAGLPDCFKQNCRDLSDTKIRSKTQKKDINLALLYQVNIIEEQGAAVTKYRISVEGRLLDLESGGDLGAFNAKSKEVDLSSGCNGGCFEDWLAEKAGFIARDVGAILSEKLANQQRRFSYQLLADGFLPDELTKIDRFITQVDGYVSHKLVTEDKATTQLLHQIARQTYQYTSVTPGSVLRSEMEVFITNMGIPMVVQYSDKTRQFTLSRSYMPYLPRYLLAALLIMTLLYVWYASAQRSKHDKNFKKYAMGQQASQWLTYFEDTKIPLAPRKKSWFEEQKHWRDKVKLSEKFADEAWLLADQHNYEGAIVKADLALTENADNQRAAQLKKQVVDLKRGYERFLLAEKELHTHPASAMNLLNEAKHLNPALESKIQAMEQQCERLMHQQIGIEALRKAKGAVDAESDFEAFSIIDQSQLQIGNLNSFAEEQQQLSALRQTLSERNQVREIFCAGTGGLSGYIFTTDDSVDIARNTSDTASTIVINYKRISRGGKQTRITRSNGKYLVTDLNSSNGTRHNDTLLEPNAGVKLKTGDVIGLGSGKSQSASQICQLTCNISQHETGSNLFLSLEREGQLFLDDTTIGQTWPSMDEDFTKTLVLLQNEVPLGVTQDGELDVGCIKCNEVLALLRYADGFYIVPKSVTLETTDIMVNGYPQYAAVPLVPGSEVRLKQFTLGIKEIS